MNLYEWYCYTIETNISLIKKSTYKTRKTEQNQKKVKTKKFEFEFERNNTKIENILKTLAKISVKKIL